MKKKIKKKIQEYQNFRKTQKSLKNYNISPTEFDVLISAYGYSEWIDYQILREFSNKSPSVFSDQAVMPLSRKGYIETKRRDANKKDTRITPKGSELVERIFGENEKI